MRVLRPASVVLGIFAVLGSACGGATQPPPSPTATSAATAAATAAARPGELDADTIAKAKKEGQVVFYTSLQTDDAEKLVKGFQAVFPEIKVQLNRKSSSGILTQYLTEAKAGKILADVLESGGLDLAAPVQQGLTVAFAPPSAKDYPKEFTQLGGHFINARTAVGTFAWNTTAVKAGDEPKTWEDLLDPKWKGKLLVEATDNDVMQALAKGHFNNDEAKVRDYFTKLAAQNPTIINGHTEQLAALIAGQGSVGFGIRGDTAQEQIDQNKAPVQWSKAEVMLRLQGPVISKDAPHPNAARVFVNWYLAKDGGQKTLAEIGRIPAAPGLANKVFTFGKTITSGPEDASDLPKYDKLWNQIILKK
jgi:iron(III) transport system substrate-binding protein